MKKPNKSKAEISVLFDLDGVLADTESLRYLSYHRLFSDVYGIELPPEIPGHIIGRPEDENIRYFLGELNVHGDVQHLMQARSEILAEIVEHGLKPSSQPLRLLQHLRVRGIRTGVVTNSSRSYARQILRLLTIEEQLEAIVTSDDVQRGKPNPEIYLTASKRLGTSPDKCVAVEDSPTGIEAAKQAGMKCIAITSSFAAHDLGSADMTVDDLTSLSQVDFRNWLIPST